MKIQMTRKLATILFIVFLTSVWTAYASYTIYSNTIQINGSEYSFSTLTVDVNNPIRYQIITFYGQLKLDGVGIGSKTVTLYESTDQLSWNPLTSNTTESDGGFMFTVNYTQVGTFYYKAGFDVP